MYLYKYMQMPTDTKTQNCENEFKLFCFILKIANFLMCYSDENWDLLDDEVKEKISFTSKADGEFWMSFKDFCRQFQEITICTLGPDFDGDGSGDKAGEDSPCTCIYKRTYMPVGVGCVHK